MLTGKHLCWCLFLKVSGQEVFSCEICKIFKNAFFHRTPPVAASVIFKQMTLYSALRNYLNFQVSDLVFRFGFQRNMYTFTRVFYWTKYHRKFEQVAEAVFCKKLLCPAALLKRDSDAVVSCNFWETFQNTCFKEHPCTSGLKVISQQLFFHLNSFNPANIYLLKVNNRNTRKKCKMC